MGRLFETKETFTVINLYVGDAQEYLSVVAKGTDPDAQLVNRNNYSYFLSDNFTSGVVYTSLADLPKIDTRNILHELMLKADAIFYSPPDVWSDHSDMFSWESQQTLVEYLLSNMHNQRHNVVGIDNLTYRKPDYLTLFDTRPDNRSCIWIAGCSIAHGVGVKPEQRFGDIIAKKINRSPVFLTQGGSSIEFQSDQILRSNLREGDIVVWGLTSELRAPKFHRILSPEKDDVVIRTSETRLYKAITSVHQVINFCEKISVKLILLPLLCTEHLRLMLSGNTCYHDLPYQPKTVDYGTDNIHPGPMQHQQWAEYCINFLNRDGKATA